MPKYFHADHHLASRAKPPFEKCGLTPLGDWPRTALEALGAHPAVARIVIASVRGSAPRPPGTCMLLDAGSSYGSIGGGQLEWLAMATARELLRSHTPPARVLRVVLGTELSQCCGGVVELWIERYTQADIPLLRAATNDALLVSSLCGGRLTRRVVPTSPDGTRWRWQRDLHTQQAELWEPLGQAATPLWLYGAGHVGQALVRVLDTLPFAVTWIDARTELLADARAAVRVLAVADPETTVLKAPPGTIFLVMTHSHPLDYALCHAALARDDAAWVGLIGSKSKAARFRSRLAGEGLGAERVARLVSPIGIDGIENKTPAAIAIAVAAQLLQWQSTQAAGSSASEAGVPCTGCAAAPRGC